MFLLINIAHTENHIKEMNGLMHDYEANTIVTTVLASTPKPPRAPPKHDLLPLSSSFPSLLAYRHAFLDTMVCQFLKKCILSLLTYRLTVYLSVFFSAV